MRKGDIVALAVCTALFSAPVASIAAPRYDVSYLWHHNLEQIVAYRDQVGRVLGPKVTKKLKVVRGPRLYGLIYHRRGSEAGAKKVAGVHTALLGSRRLEAAVPIRSRDWTFVADNGARHSPRAVKVAVASLEQQWEIRDLETAVTRYITHLRSTGKLAPDERTAWSVRDFTTGEHLVSINEDVQLQAASLVKPFFALAFFHQVKDGKLKYGRKSRRHMERMIQRSSNRSTNWIIRHVGGPDAVQRVLKQHYPEIFQDTHIVEYVPAGGRTFRNKASANDYDRFLTALWNKEIPGAKEIMRLMRLPGPDRLYTGTPNIPPGTKVYNKTGSTSQLCGDMGILVVKGKNGRRYPYTLVGVIEKPRGARNYSAWIRSRANVIRKVSGLVYRGISQHHDLHRSF
jgi:beta-lactamase class A